MTIDGLRGTAMLLMAAILLGAGCGKFELPFGKEKAERDEKTVEQLRQIEEDRVATIMTQQPPFNRQAALEKILKQRFEYDLQQRFPDGIDETMLMTPDQARAELKQRVETVVDEKFPPEQRDRLVELAALQYPLHRLGEDVTLPLLGNKQVSGTLRQVHEDWVMVGGKRILMQDILPPARYSLDPKVNQQYRDLYVRKKYDIGRKDLMGETIAKLKPQVYRDCGFLQYRGRWLRIDDLIAKVLDPHLDKLAERYREDLEERVREQVRDAMRAEGLEPAPPMAPEFAEVDDPTLDQAPPDDAGFVE